MTTNQLTDTPWQDAGDPACWLRFVCPHCGRMREDATLIQCPNCAEPGEENQPDAATSAHC